MQAGSRRREAIMPPVLKQLIGRQRDARALVAAICRRVRSAHHDRRRRGPAAVRRRAVAARRHTRVPVTHLEASLGWVAGPPHARTVAAVLDHLVAQGDREEGPRRRGAAPVPRDQPDLQLLGEAGVAARARTRRPAHPRRGTAGDRRHRRRAHAARPGHGDPDDHCRLRRPSSRPSTAFAAATASSGRSRRAGSARS